MFLFWLLGASRAANCCTKLPCCNRLAADPEGGAQIKAGSPEFYV
jgi:hypothetical protein